MRKFLFGLTFLLISYISFGQVSANCANAVPFCTSMSYNIPLATNTTAETGPDYTCLYTQPNPAWYYLQISQAGPITIHMASTANVDVDFSCWGPFTTLAGACNNLTSSNTVDCSYSTAAQEDCVIPNAQVGQFYILVITNYANVPTNVAFSQTSGTGATDCSIVPPSCTTDAGLHQDICGLTATLSGNLSPDAPAISATGHWTGTGTFNNSNIANPTVTVSAYNHYVYTLTETNNNGCVATDTVSVDFYEDPIYSVPNPFATVCELSYQLSLQCTNTGNGSFSAQTNTIGQWTWTGPTGALVTFTPNAQTINAITTVSLYGTYVFTWTGINGPCSTNSSITVQFNPNPVFSVVTTPELCVGSCNGTANVTGVTMPYVTLPLMPMNNLCAGTYSVTLTDVNGCSSQMPFVVDPAIPITHSETHINLLCFNDHTGTIQLTTAGGTGAGTYTYLWSPNVSNTSQGSGLSAGVYSILVSDANGCNYTENITLTEPQPLTISATTTDSTICIGENTLITTTTNGGTQPYIYLWNDLNSTTNDQVSPVVSTLYQVVVKDLNNCVSTDQQMIYVSPQMTIIPVTTDVSCFGFSDGSVTLNISGGVQPYTYSWSSTTNTLTGLSANPYTVIVTDAYNCGSTATYTILEPTQLTYTSIITQPLCHGQQGTIDINASGGTPTYTYHWSNGYGNDIISITAGVINLILEDAKHCEVTGSFTISDPEPLSIVGENVKTICYGTDVDLFVNGFGGTFPYSYHWSTQEVAPQITVEPLQTTQYDVTVVDANGCTAGPMYITVNVMPELCLDVVLQNDTICPGNYARIDVFPSGFCQEVINNG